MGFVQFVYNREDYSDYGKDARIYLIPWLFNAENFFNAMSEWLKQKNRRLTWNV